MNAPDLGDLGYFLPKAPHAYLGRDLPEGQPTQGDEFTRLIWLLVDAGRSPRDLLSLLLGFAIHSTCQAAAGSRFPENLCWDRRRRRRSSWS